MVAKHASSQRRKGLLGEIRWIRRSEGGKRRDGLGVRCEFCSLEPTNGGEAAARRLQEKAREVGAPAPQPAAHNTAAPQHCSTAAPRAHALDCLGLGLP
ncbi:hypothetical protein M3J09_008554 [Ascochyta lentis]